MTTPKKILIVEDESSLRKILKNRLQQEGFVVLEAKNVPEGLEQVTSSLPDLILLDIIMPQKNGMALLKELQKNEDVSDTPVIILTNLSNSEAIFDSFEFEITSFSNGMNVETDLLSEESYYAIKQYLTSQLPNRKIDFVVKSDIGLDELVTRAKKALGDSAEKINQLS